MSGLKLVLPTAFTDNTLPFLRADPMLAAGSLALIEPGHPLGVLSGVPANGALIPNIAWQEAKALGAATSQSDASAIFGRTGFNGVSGTVERSTKGGLHGIASQASGVANDGARIDLSALIKSYIVANPTHQFFVSVWTDTTRATTGTGAGGTQERRFHLAGTNLGSTFLLAEYANTGGMKVYPASPVGKRESNSTTGKTHVNVAHGTWTGTAPAAVDLEAAAALWGPIGRYTGSRTPNMHSSYVLYRFYLEDLTVSGRTYAAADALAQDEFTKHVLTSGGRYYGDTYTSPSTLP